MATIRSHIFEAIRERDAFLKKYRDKTVELPHYVGGARGRVLAVTVADRWPDYVFISPDGGPAVAVRWQEIERLNPLIPDEPTKVGYVYERGGRTYTRLGYTPLWAEDQDRHWFQIDPQPKNGQAFHRWEEIHK